MGGNHQPSDPGQLVVSQRAKIIYSVLMFVGLVTFIFTVYNSPDRAWHAYLIGFFYFTSLALGGFFFTAIQHATKAGWSVNVRRIMESFMSFLPLGAVFALILVIGAPHLYEWLHPEEVAADYLLKHKEGYLNRAFYIIRMVVFFGGWLWIGGKMVKRSLAQDESGDVELTHKNTRLAVGALVFFALSYSLFSVDALMSIEAHWFSTIFGVYTFAGLFQSSMAFMILTIFALHKRGYLKEYVTMDHVHDLGKFLFGFTVFWAYIGFSQYMLIWYANLPEESFYYVTRSQEPWVYVSLALLIFKFVVPFFALLPRWAKRTPAYLTPICYLILIMQFVDI
ncbi:MAG: molybdopterin oxidoreductase, partial [Bdellovibrionales bacterium]